MLGAYTCDDDGGQVGNFWMMIQTRPYTRVLQAMVRIAFEKRLQQIGVRLYIHSHLQLSSCRRNTQTATQ